VTLAGVSVSGATPVPVSATVCGLSIEVSLTLSVPVLVPAAVGANLTLIVQVAPAKTLAAQLLVWLKSPLAKILVIVSVVGRWLVRVTA
jgi:hypothetical protein